MKLLHIYDIMIVEVPMFIPLLEQDKQRTLQIAINSINQTLHFDNNLMFRNTSSLYELIEV